MELLVRTWNLFHGRSVPSTGRLDVETMVRIAAGDGPDVLCLQEVPVWALRLLPAWSGMASYGAVAMPPLGGPLARRLTDRWPDLLRSALSGQANAILVGRRLTIADRRRVVLNPAAVRDREARRLRLPASVRLAWQRNRRILQAARVAAGERSLLVGNAHLTTHPDVRLAERELLAAVGELEGMARPEEPIVLCGDLNLDPAGSRVLRGLAGRGLAGAGAGIDHILVRGARLVRGPEAWPEERRRAGGVLLSDHAPVEAAMIVP